MAVMAIVMGTTFTSCLNSDSESSWDGYAYGTVDLSYLLVDGGLKFYPTNMSTLKDSNGELPERVFFSYKLVEGQEITEGKTNYDISIVSFASLPVRRLTADPDTIGNVSGVPVGEGQGISQFTSNSVWAYNGYFNLGFVTSYDSKTSFDHFDLFPNDVIDGVLYMRLHQNQKIVSTSGNIELLMSFKPFTKMELSDQLEDKYADLNFFGTASDSVKVVVVADNGSGSTIKTSAVGVKVSSY